MIGGSELSLRDRLKGVFLFLGFVLGGIAAVWLGLAGLLAAVHGLMTQAPLLELSPVDARALFAGFALLMLAAMMLLTVPDWAKGGPRRRRRTGTPVARDWGGS